MSLTKRKDEDGSWRVCLDGRPTSLCIVKGSPPRYREPREWHVIRGADFLFSAPGLEIAMRKLDTLRAALA